ncbi:MAG TPA: lysozyme [Rhodocyclaceae bacterium]|nr:lysozyme [Rhodocyclaceae bacterium]
MSPIEIAAVLCAKFEGFFARPYLCPAGVPTIGYGATRYPDGRAVTLHDAPITRATALLYLQFDLRADAVAVQKLCPGSMAERRRGALLDFAYNCGVGALRSSTLRRRVNAADWESVPAEFRKWVRGGGRVLVGLVRRRNAEAALVVQE